MNLLLVFTYTAFCIFVFKLLRIPLNKWTVPTAVLGGALLISSLIFIMNYNHPYSEVSREYFVTTPIVPTVTGKVVEVTATGQTKLNKGDVIFKLDPKPFESKIDSIKVQLDTAVAELKQQQELTKKKKSNKGSVDLAITKIDNLKEQLAAAESKLNQTVVRAPTAGYVTQLTLKPGMMIPSLPAKPAMIFVHDDGNNYVAWFRQNSMLRLQAGKEAEVAFDSIPGRVFSGEVKMVSPAMNETQIQSSDKFYDPRRSPRPGLIPVLINITDPSFEQYTDKVPADAYTQTAIYTEHIHHVAIIRKVLLRMLAWMNYLS